MGKFTEGCNNPFGSKISGGDVWKDQQGVSLGYAEDNDITFDHEGLGLHSKELLLIFDGLGPACIAEDTARETLMMRLKKHQL